MKDINISSDCPWFWYTSIRTSWAHSFFGGTACPYFLEYPSSSSYHCSATCNLSISSHPNRWHGPQPDGLFGWVRLFFCVSLLLVQFWWNWNWRLFLFFWPTWYCWQERRDFGFMSMFYGHLCNPSGLRLRFGWFLMMSN